MNERINLKRINLIKKTDEDLSIDDEDLTIKKEKTKKQVILERFWNTRDIEGAFKILEEHKEELGDNFIQDYFLRHVAEIYIQINNLDEILKSVEEHKDLLGDNFIKKDSYLLRHVASFYYGINDLDEIFKSVEEHKEVLGENFIQDYFLRHLAGIYIQINNLDEIFKSVEEHKDLLGDNFIQDYLLRHVAGIYIQINNLDEIFKSVEEHKDLLGDNFIQDYYLLRHVADLYYETNDLDEILKSVEEHKDLLGDNFIKKYSYLFNYVYNLYCKLNSVEEILKSVEEHKDLLGDNFIKKDSYLLNHVANLYYEINDLDEILKSVEEHKEVLGDYFIQKHADLRLRIIKLVDQINDKEKLLTSIKKYRYIIGEYLILDFLERIAYLYRKIEDLDEILKSVEEYKEVLGENFIQVYLLKHVAGLYSRINNLDEIFKSVEEHKEELGENFIQDYLLKHVAGLYSQINNLDEIFKSVEEHKEELGENFIQGYLLEHVAELYVYEKNINDLDEILKKAEEHKEELGENFIQGYLLENVAELYVYEKNINDLDEIFKSVEEHKEVLGENFIQDYLLEHVEELYVNLYAYEKNINDLLDEIFKSAEEHKEVLGENFIQDYMLEFVAELYVYEKNINDLDEILKSVEEHKEVLGNDFIQEYLLKHVRDLYYEINDLDEILKSVEEHKEVLVNDFIQRPSTLYYCINKLVYQMNDKEKLLTSIKKYRYIIGEDLILDFLKRVAELYNEINDLDEIFKSVEAHKEVLGENFIQNYKSLLDHVAELYKEINDLDEILKSLEEHKEVLGDEFIEYCLSEFVLNLYNQYDNIEEIIKSVEKHLNILLSKFDLNYFFSKALNIELAKKIMNEVKDNQINNIDKFIKEESNVQLINEAIVQGAILKVIKQKIEHSNSIEIIRMKDELIKNLLLININQVEEYYSSIENMFLRDNIPEGIKLYQVFKILNPDSTYLTSDCISSPALLSDKISLNKKYELLQNDMIRVTMGSNPYEMYRYIDKMQSDLIKLKTILEFKNNNSNIKYEELNDEYKKYISKILQIANAWGFVYGFNEKDIDVIYNEYLNENLVEGIENWIISIFSDASSINFSSLSDLKKYVRKNANETTEKNKNEAEMIIKNEGRYKLEVGDYIKGVKDYEKYLKDILESGVNCKEMLGASAGSDFTHLDTDLSIISNNSDYINIAMNGTYADKFCKNLWFVFKDKNNRFNKTNINDDNFDLSSTKMELFPLLGQTGNYGVRSGIPSSEIDFMICNKFDSWIGYAIAMNGIYIPVVDKSGEVVFSPDDFKDIRKELAGLKRYYADEPILSESYKIPGLNNFVDEIRKDRPNTQMKNTVIKNVLSKTLKESGYNTVYNLSNDYTSDSVELIGTGSTERGNNAIGDCDFDYMLRLNNEIFENRSELFDKLCELFNGLGGVPIGGHKRPDRIRYENIFIEGIEKTIDIDVSFEIKTNKVKYTSDIALKEKMDSIREKYGEDTDYVSANIVLAKKILKNGGIYKKTEGGISGIGVENWILKNNGSLIDAIESFIDAAKKSNGISEFINNYSIFDFGENFYNNGYNGGHDNYTKLLKVKDDDRNLSEDQKNKNLNLMKETLEKFLKEYNEALKNGNANEFIAELVGTELETKINTNSSVRK